MGSLNIFIRLANNDDASIHNGLRILFQRIFNRRIDTCMEPYLTNTYLFCVYKDETDHSKLWHIGVPTALQRIITNHTARSYNQKFSLDLLPFNCAIGIDSDIDFVMKASQLSAEKYITNKQK